MIWTDLLSGLIEADTDLLLAINGWRAGWADTFMYAFSGKWIWVPMYASILYVLFRNLHWKWVLGCIITIALTITFADQVCATFIRPYVCRLRPANLENPISDMVQIVNGYRGGRYGFPSCHCPYVVHHAVGAGDVLFAFLFGGALSGRLAGWGRGRFCRCYPVLLAFCKVLQVQAAQGISPCVCPNLGGRGHCPVDGGLLLRLAHGLNNSVSSSVF